MIVKWIFMQLLLSSVSGSLREESSLISSMTTDLEDTLGITTTNSPKMSVSSLESTSSALPSTTVPALPVPTNPSSLSRTRRSTSITTRTTPTFTNAEILFSETSTNIQSTTIQSILPTDSATITVNIPIPTSLATPNEWTFSESTLIVVAMASFIIAVFFLFLFIIIRKSMTRICTSNRELKRSSSHLYGIDSPQPPVSPLWTPPMVVTPSQMEPIPYDPPISDEGETKSSFERLLSELAMPRPYTPTRPNNPYDVEVFDRPYSRANSIKSHRPSFVGIEESTTVNEQSSKYSSEGNTIYPEDSISDLGAFPNDPEPPTQIRRRYSTSQEPTFSKSH